MPRCSDCHWFYNVPEVAREPKSCGDLGELAQSLACDRFVTRQQEIVPAIEPKVELTAEKVSNIIGALTKEQYRGAFREIIAESFVLEQDAMLTVKQAQYELQTQGAEITLPAENFQRYTGKIVDLYVLYRLCCSMGMGAFVEDIMAREIDNKFQPPIPTKLTKG